MLHRDSASMKYPRLPVVFIKKAPYLVYRYLRSWLKTIRLRFDTFVYHLISIWTATIGPLFYYSGYLTSLLSLVICSNVRNFHFFSRCVNTKSVREFPPNKPIQFTNSRKYKHVCKHNIFRNGKTNLWADFVVFFCACDFWIIRMAT